MARQLRGSGSTTLSDAKATKGRRTGALSGDRSHDSSKAATTSRGCAWHCCPCPTPVPRPGRGMPSIAGTLQADAWGRAAPARLPTSHGLQTVKRARLHLSGPGRPAAPLSFREPGVPLERSSRRFPIPNAQPRCLSGNEPAEQRRRKTLGPSALIGLPRRGEQRLATQRCQSPRPEPSPGKRKLAWVPGGRRAALDRTLGELASATASAAAFHPVAGPQALPVLQADAGEGRAGRTEHEEAAAAAK